MATKEPEYVEKDRSYQRQYYLANREKKLAYARANQQQANKLRRERRRARAPLSGTKAPAKQDAKYHTERQAEERFRLKVKALRIVAGQREISCCRCGCSDIRVLVINHKNGDGWKDVSSRNGPSRIRSRIVK